MDAQTFVDTYRQTTGLIQLAHYTGRQCDGIAWALILSDSKGIAILVQDCGPAGSPRVRGGAIVNFQRQREGLARIVGKPAYFDASPTDNNPPEHLAPADRRHRT